MAYAEVFGIAAQVLGANECVEFPCKNVVKNFKHRCTKLITKVKGLYEVTALLNVSTPCQFTVFINDKPVKDLCTSGLTAASGEVRIQTYLPLRKGDKLTVKNHTSSTNPVTLAVNAGGVNHGYNCKLLVKRFDNFTEREWWLIIFV